MKIRKTTTIIFAICIMFVIITGCNQKNTSNIQHNATIEIMGTTSILESTAITFYEGESVLDSLKNIAQAKKIPIDFDNMTGYIKGIDNLYEFDKGGTSGWKYLVNDKYPSMSAKDYKLLDGDSVKFLYSEQG